MRKGTMTQKAGEVPGAGEPGGPPLTAGPLPRNPAAERRAMEQRAGSSQPPQSGGGGTMTQALWQSDAPGGLVMSPGSDTGPNRGVNAPGMMGAVRNIRNTVLGMLAAVARQTAAKPFQPRLTTAQSKVVGKESDIHDLPVDFSNWQALQVRGGVKAGLPYYIPDFDPPDSTLPKR